MAYDDNPEDLAMMIACEANARALLPIKNRATHMKLILNVCDEIREAIEIGAEFVGAQGHLQYDEDTGEWS